jgi:5-methylcytosine-specific restriction endonuclease McrA
MNDTKSKRPGAGSGSGARIVAEARRAREEREKGYRERALKLFPPVCGRCGREFQGKKLRELTVHHRDHNHDNNPPDGSNWELLCVYCHDNEHSRTELADWTGKEDAPAAPERGLTHQPFAGLEALLKGEK